MIRAQRIRECNRPVECPHPKPADFGDLSTMSLRAFLLFVALLNLAAFTISCGGGSMNLTPSSSAPSTAKLSVQPAGNGDGTVSSTPPGISCQPTCGATFKIGTKVALTATPTGGSMFAGWGDACSGMSSCTVTLEENTSAVATFSLLPLLTVTNNGTGLGSVTSNPSGIDCGHTCSAAFRPGTQVTLTATPGSNSSFAGWSGGGCSGNSSTCTLILSANTQVSASFGATTIPVLSVALSGTGQGTVTSNPSGINCGPTCSAGFKSGTRVVLTETPGTNSTFTGWSGGGCSGTSSSCTVTLTANTQVSASFGAATIPVLSVALSGTGQGSVTSNPSGINCGQT